MGLDIGTSSIKLARISSSEGRMYLDTFGLLPTPPGAFQEGRIRNMDALAGALSDLLRHTKIRQKTPAAMAVGRNAAMIKRFSSFHGVASGLEEIISAQAEQYFPHDIDILNLDFQVMDASFPPSADAGGDVLAAAVKKVQVRERMELADRTGICLRILDAEPFALQNIHERLCHADEPRMHLLVDMGEEGSTLTFVAGREPVTVRENMSGVWQILNEIQHDMNIDREEARQILTGANAWETVQNQTRLMGICRQSVGAWCMEIQEQIRFFQDENPHARIEKVFLSGGGAGVGEFQKTLAQVLGIPVSVMDPLKEISADHTRFFPSAEEIGSHCTAIALGLALRKSGDHA